MSLVARSSRYFGVLLATVLPLGAGPARAQEPAATGDAQAPAVTETPPDHGAVMADPLGFLLFGPTVGVELALGRYSVLAYGRWLDAGVLAKSMFEDASNKFRFSYGGGLKGRYYSGPGLTRTHVGIALEVLKTRMDNDTDRVATKNLVLVPEIEGGYRFAFGRFFVDGALGLGYALQVSKSMVNINGGTQANLYEAKDVSTIYGSASVDFGVLF